MSRWRLARAILPRLLERAGHGGYVQAPPEGLVTFLAGAEGVPLGGSVARALAFLVAHGLVQRLPTVRFSTARYRIRRAARGPFPPPPVPRPPARRFKALSRDAGTVRLLAYLRTHADARGFVLGHCHRVIAAAVGWNSRHTVTSAARQLARRGLIEVLRPPSGRGRRTVTYRIRL